MGSRTIRNKVFTFQVIHHETPWQDFTCEERSEDRLRVFLDVTGGRDEAYEHYTHRVEEVRFTIWRGEHVVMNKSKNYMVRPMRGESNRYREINFYQFGFTKTLSLKINN